MVPDEPTFTLEMRPADDGRTRVVAAGELDLAEAARFREAVTEQLAAGSVLLDLSELRFMDSSGVRALDALLRACADQSWDLQIAEALQQPVRQVLEMTGMIELLPLVPVEDAG